MSLDVINRPGLTNAKPNENQFGNVSAYAQNIEIRQ